MTDSAGRPWHGRALDAAPGPWAADDGRAPADYVAARDAMRAGRVGPAAVLDALRTARLLVPLVAEAAAAETTEGVAAPSRATGHDRATAHDRAAELALVTVAGPDGRGVLPAFSSAAAMARWDPAARPVPAPARQVALGAAADGTELVIVDAASPERFGLRRPALEALARDLPWVPPLDDPAVVTAIGRAADGEPAVAAVRVGSGDPACTLDGPEVRVVLTLAGPLGRDGVRTLLARVQGRWRDDTVVRDRVDSISVGVGPAP